MITKITTNPLLFLNVSFPVLSREKEILPPARIYHNLRCRFDQDAENRSWSYIPLEQLFDSHNHLIFRTKVNLAQPRNSCHNHLIFRTKANLTQPRHSCRGEPGGNHRRWPYKPWVTPMIQLICGLPFPQSPTQLPYFFCVAWPSGLMDHAIHTDSTSGALT